MRALLHECVHVFTKCASSMMCALPKGYEELFTNVCTSSRIFSALQCVVHIIRLVCPSSRMYFLKFVSCVFLSLMWVGEEWAWGRCLGRERRERPNFKRDSPLYKTNDTNNANDSRTAPRHWSIFIARCVPALAIIERCGEGCALITIMSSGRRGIAHLLRYLVLNTSKSSWSRSDGTAITAHSTPMWPASPCHCSRSVVHYVVMVADKR